MRLINPSFEVLEQVMDYPIHKFGSDKNMAKVSAINSAKKQIELAGRVCYKSEDKITDFSYESFFKMIRGKKHLSVFEHGTLYFTIIIGDPNSDNEYIKKCQIVQVFKRNPYSKVIEDINSMYDSNGNKLEENRYFYITTNYRVVEENFNTKEEIYINGFGEPVNKITENDLFKFLCQPTDKHNKRISVKFICSRGISHELVRHRVFSFSQESQRYCNYSKGKFNQEITFIKPEYEENITKFKEALQEAEKNYFYLIGLNQTPQEAREVLPNATKTEIIMTGYISDWKYFFELRTSENAHPEMRRLIIPLQEKFKELGYV